MANEKTLLLSGTEQEIIINGQNVDIRNDGTETIYISRDQGIIPNADGVMSIPAGQAAKYHNIHGKVYVLGTGSVQLCGNDYNEPVFKAAAATGGAEDPVARTSISTHAANSDIHITTEERKKWNSAGGRNLLLNSYFMKPINQRGKASYTSSGSIVSIDGWRTIGGCVLSFNDNGSVILQGNGATNWAGLEQRFEYPERFSGRDFVLSVCTIGTAGEKHNILVATSTGGVDWRNDFESTGGIDVAKIVGTFPESMSFLRVVITSGSSANPTAALNPLWAKFEFGTEATPYYPPDETEELAKCQHFYQVHSTGDIDAVDLRPTMREIKKIELRDDGNYAYMADLTESQQ